MPYTKTVVTVKKVSITREEAKGLIVEARINEPGEIDLYAKNQELDGYLHRVATIPFPSHIYDTTAVKDYVSGSDILLEYAREHMPTEIHC